MRPASWVLLVALTESMIAGAAPSTTPSTSPAQYVAVLSGTAPSISAPSSVSTTGGLGFSLAATISDPDPGDSVGLSVSGLPPGLRMAATKVAPGVSIAAITGVAPSEAQQISLVWEALDTSGHATRATTVLSIVPPDSAGDTRSKARKLVIGRYYHGIPGEAVRNLGPRALPYFTEVLRDPTAKKYWGNAALAAGFLGIPAAYDSLYDFIWKRFSGPVDDDTFAALMRAQSVLGVIEPARPELFDYLVRSCDPAFWDSLPWQERHGPIEIVMSGKSIYALSIIPEGRATLALEHLRDEPYSPYQRDYIDDALRTRPAIIERGWLAIREEVRAENGRW